jgi:hypothetical protein
MTLGQTAYEAYAESTGWETFDGRPMLSWSELGETNSDIQAAWEAAAQAAAQAEMKAQGYL